MAFGKGRYDDLASHVRGIAEAEGVLLLIIKGTRGSGFSAQLSGVMLSRLPTILRDIARQLEDESRPMEAES